LKYYEKLYLADAVTLMLEGDTLEFSGHIDFSILFPTAH
jgi:hypothetical protein